MLQVMALREKELEARLGTQMQCCRQIARAKCECVEQLR